MLILGHRGYWKDDHEKNSLVALKRSLELGFGVETDIRDYNGELVISHDIPSGDCIRAEEFFKIAAGTNLPLALNIKSDGLQDKLKDLIEKYHITNYFVFDMSLPDAVVYLSCGLNLYSRQSEYEVRPLLYKQSAGIWLDAFESLWYNVETIEQHLAENKVVCIVSPELHKRDYLQTWNMLLNIGKVNNNCLMLCTDYPEQARKFFNGKN